ncbi:hypothetical protein [Streptomyces sp. NPDC007883]|uniref:hypothetical protein n=1 Tax=Streptomyces sp. NPDC007883 TaxID=3155116 RepID=UPI0033C9C553
MSGRYTDADLARLSGPRTRLELALTQNVLAGTAGIGTHLLRLPHTAGPATLCGAMGAAAYRALDDGYVVITADPPGRTSGQGAVRTLTGSPAAVGETERLLAAGGGEVRFTTIGRGLGLTGTTYGVSTAAEWRGAAVVRAQQASRAFADAMTWFLVVAGVLTAARLVMLFTVARVHVKRVRARRPRRSRRRGGPLVPPSPIRSR